MASFNDAIAGLITLLETNPPLTNFVLAKWQKKLTVLAVYKDKTEVHDADLPLIMIVRPQLTPSYVENKVYGGHLVRLIYGFLQNDKLKGQPEAIEFEEKITDALLLDPSLGGVTENVTPGVTVTDEGRNHPRYFGVKNVDVMHKR